MLHRPLSSFISAGKGSDARAVLVDGQIVYRDGQFAHLADVAGVIAEAERIGRAIVDKAGLSHRLGARLAHVTNCRRAPRRHWMAYSGILRPLPDTWLAKIVHGEAGGGNAWT